MRPCFSDLTESKSHNNPLSLVTLVLVLNVTAYNNIQQNQQFIELKKDCEAKDVEVRRDGKKITISSEDIVVGDLVFVETGDKIIADGFYVEGQGFKVSEAAMTGETNLYVAALAPLPCNGLFTLVFCSSFTPATIGRNSNSLVFGFIPQTCEVRRKAFYHLRN